MAQSVPAAEGENDIDRLVTFRNVLSMLQLINYQAATIRATLAIGLVLQIARTSIGTEIIIESRRCRD